MKIQLARQLIESTKPRATPQELRDTKVGGLLLRVQPSGVKSYIVEWARGRRRTIGRHPVMTLDGARETAKRLLGQAAEHGAPTAVIEAELAAQGIQEVTTFGEFIETRYGPHVQATAKAGAATVQSLAKQFGHLYPRELSSISRADFDAFKAKRLRAKVHPATVNRDLDRIKAALSAAVHWDLLPNNPLAGVKRIKRDIEERVRYLSPAEERALRKALALRDDTARTRRKSGNAWRAERGEALLPRIVAYSDHLTPMTLIALNTGLRRGEIVQLTWDDIDLRGKRLTVRAGYAKSGKTRHLPLNSEVVTVLNSYPKQEPGVGRLFAIAGIGKAWERLMQAAGIEDFRFHDLRHTFASKLVMAGIDLNTVRELLGHGDIKMTLRYAHLAPEHKAAAVEKLVRRKA
jgi:integrase